MAATIKAGLRNVVIPGGPLVQPLEPGQHVIAPVRSTWFEMPLNSSWKVALRLLEQSGRVCISEFRIYPLEKEPLEAGLWSGEYWGDLALCPRGGLTARTIRLAPLGELAKRIAKIMEATAKRKGPPKDPMSIDDLVQKSGLTVLDGSHLSQAERDSYEPFGKHGTFGSLGLTDPTAKVKVGVRGRPPIADRECLKVAAFYVRRMSARSRKPSAETATRFEITLPRVKVILAEARRRQLLTKTEMGSAGGELTPKAKTLRGHPTLLNKPKPVRFDQSKKSGSKRRRNPLNNK